MEAECGRVTRLTASADHGGRTQAASARGRHLRASTAAHQMSPSAASSASRPAGFRRPVRGEDAGAAPARDWAAAYCRRRAVRRTSSRRPCSRGWTASRPGLHSRRHRAAARLRGAALAARVSLEHSRQRGGRRQALPARWHASRACRSTLRAPRSRPVAIHSMPARRAAPRSRAPATRAAARRRPAGSDGASGRSAIVAALLWDSRERVRSGTHRPVAAVKARGYDT